MKEGVDNKYNPRWKILDKKEKLIYKWKVPEREKDFFYEHNFGFRSEVDTQLNCEGSDKRKLALKKLYFDY